MADTLTIPVSDGEQEYSQRRFRWMIQNRGVDIVQPDLHYYGGFIRSSRVAHMAAVAGMPTTVHISGGFGSYICSILPPIYRLYQEYKKGIERYNNWLNLPLKVEDGAITVPAGPGSGIRDVEYLLKEAEPMVSLL